MSKRAHIRQRRGSDDDDNSQPGNDDSNGPNSNEGSDSGVSMEDLKLIQKLRQRKKGVSAEELALGKQANPLFGSKKNDSNDPYKLKTGGLVDMNSSKSQQRGRSSKDLSTINDNFARETNTRDEDTEMQRYIEEQLIKIQQKSTATSNSSTNDELKAVFATLKKPEDTLFHVSKHLITDHSAQASEEMLSEQMLSGIPEVDIGVEEKIRNIEETDRAKRKLLQTLCEKKGVEKKMSTIVSQTPTPISILASTPVVPTKPASISFVQHKRFTTTDGMDILHSKRLKQNQIKDTVKPQPVVGNKEKHPTLLRDSKPAPTLEKPLSETATDDLVFDQFRKNLHGSRNWKIRHA
ncbi:unnamed protein product [Rotaria magnacalcarata]|uniref:Uncharacterized protein n=2 Tax=Rotaria magnacalcarata TaxID=392030 RepID=A0A816F0B3_9BILA|nr:unnamed protein product [Rotaria magnacalcarata]CAF1653223.1 unnamed protein product [Rotaria magnacalcarata]CAF2049901.1 unnamed protein product [Rotaria magnacalcarata]CAF2229560.1 unnamed protein product [Rotaria magnacalcarata]CAF2229562.1 unnamed protein product [Rotaria magnacalcarata]